MILRKSNRTHLKWKNLKPTGLGGKIQLAVLLYPQSHKLEPSQQTILNYTDMEYIFKLWKTYIFFIS